MDQTATSDRVFSLGIETSIDDVAGLMQPGHMYGMEARIPSLRFPLIAAALESAFASDRPCTMVVKARPEAYLAQLNTPRKQGLETALATGALNVLVMREDFSKRMFQHGAQRLTRELDGFGVTPGSLLVFEHAGELETLGAWCQERECTLLLVFSGNPERNTVPVTDLLDAMSGLACLEAVRGTLSVDVPYWRCNGRLGSCHHVALRLDRDGYYRASGVNSADIVLPRLVQLPGMTEFKEFAAGAEPLAAAEPVLDAVASAHAGRHPAPRTLRSFEGRARTSSGLSSAHMPGRSDRATRARFVDTAEPV
jgi:hypothetical protein